MAADEKCWQSVLDFARACSPYSRSTLISLWFAAGTPLAQVVNGIRRMADDNQMVIEWGCYDKRLAPDADEDAESFVLASVYRDGGPQEMAVCLNLRMPGVAYELCEALWGRPQAIECFDPWDIGDV